MVARLLLLLQERGQLEAEGRGRDWALLQALHQWWDARVQLR
jgi:hypothetical protein